MVRARWSQSRAPIFGEAHRNALIDVASRYRALFKAPSVAAEAHLRFGFLQFVLGDRSAARTHAAEADRISTDSIVRYQSHVVAAWAWQSDRRPVEAAAAYRAALELFPLARSAAAPLGALLVEAGALDDAESLLERALLSRPVPVDPLDRFSDFDGWQWPDRLARIREAVR